MQIYGMKCIDTTSDVNESAKDAKGHRENFKHCNGSR